ncbi:MAG: o-succinylbenzoate synthase [bacterium]
MEAKFKRFTLKFIEPMGTSRGILRERETHILGLENAAGTLGLGECAPLTGLSIDDRPHLAQKLQAVCDQLNDGKSADELDLSDWPAIQFGVETALLDLRAGGTQLLFDTSFTRGTRLIATNGLIVMGQADHMLRQVVDKVAAGFRCIKIKVGALKFDDECRLLTEVRKQFPPRQIELRLDANGAFDEDEALEKLKRLSEFTVHSLEQPIKAGRWQAMARLCCESPIAIALDEELIGIETLAERRELLQTIRPQFIILKPTLLGGFESAQVWIDLAETCDIGTWVTSALESNVGLNSISQWTSTRVCNRVQGLGTGRLYQTNFASALSLREGALHYDPRRAPSPPADLSQLQLQ